MSELTLEQLPFIDLYVRLDHQDRAYYRSRERGKGTVSQFVPPEYQVVLDRFMTSVPAALGEAMEGSFDFEGLRCRLSRQKMSDGTTWVSVRRINTIIPQLDKIGFAPHIYNHMHGLGMREGLILVSGASGQGKTTTAVALLADFLKTYGGTAITIEDPVEYMLKGRHGEGGMCYQVEVKQEEDWAVCLKRALRWAPRYIFVGEIRTPKAAEQLLRAATTGHLVITTVHASAPEEALMGLIFLAEQAMGPGANNMLSAGITALIYQTMKEQGPQVRYVYTEPEAPGDPIRSIIRDNKIGTMSTYIDRTAVRLAAAAKQPSPDVSGVSAIPKPNGSTPLKNPGSPSAIPKATESHKAADLPAAVSPPADKISNPTLDDLPFIDLYVRLDEPDQAYYRSREKGKGMISQFVPPEYQLVVDRFMTSVTATLGETMDGSIDFEGLRCRLSRQKLSDGTVWVCARRINTIIPQLDKLGFAPHIYNHMHGLGKREGLILISGATGQGKTTTAVALLADFLRTYGGTAITIEDPVEYMLKGRHGEGGMCYQIEVKQEEDWATCLKRALRWGPQYIYVGEIRTPKAAEQLLRAATTGHLVITTVHAGAPEEALMGLIFLAEQAMGPGANNMLSAGITALIYQTMKEQGPQVRYVYTEPDEPSDPIRSLIRENKIGMMSTYIDRTAARLANGTIPTAPIPSAAANTTTTASAATATSPQDLQAWALAQKAGAKPGAPPATSTTTK